MATTSWWRFAELTSRVFVLSVLVRSLHSVLLVDHDHDAGDTIIHRSTKALMTSNTDQQDFHTLSNKEMWLKNHNTAALCVVQKDEHRYLNEWVDYHLALGFSDIYIYDNSDSHKPLLQWNAVRRSRVNPTINVTSTQVHLIHYPGQRVQIPVYKDCATRVKARYHTWVSFLDVDEFLVLKRHDNVVEFAQEYAKPGQMVGINWKFFGTAGRHEYETFPVTQRFQCVHSTSKHFFIKSLMRVTDIHPISHIHSPHMFPRRQGVKLVDTNGKEIGGSKHKGPRDVALVYHYAYRSHQEHVDKRTRGDVYFGNRKDRNDWGKQAQQGIDPWTGKPLPDGSTFDDTAWVTLKRLVPDFATKYENRTMREEMSCAIHKDVTSQKVDQTKDEAVEEPRTEDTVALCAVAKDESWYMNEWTDYHLALGFSDLYIYDVSANSHTSGWSHRHNDSRIHVIPFAQDEDFKTSAYQNCTRMMTKFNHTWVLFSDINQFLVLRQQENVLDFAKKYVQEGQIGVNWKVFGSAGRKKYESWPVTQRFPCRLSYFFIDSMRMNTFAKVSDLGPPQLITNTTEIPRKLGTRLLDTSQKRIINLDRHNGPRDVVVIHHYLTKSEEEHATKLGQEKGKGSGIFYSPPKGPTQEMEEVPAGSIYDDTAWQVLKRNDPSYTRYEKRLPIESPKCEYSPEGF